MIIERSEGAILKLIELLDNKYQSNQVLIVCGKYYSKKIANRILSESSSNGIVLIVDDTAESLSDISYNIDESSILIGVGGGKLMDISKEIAFQNNIDLILFPTVISNDGLANGLVVLNSVNNGQSIYRMSADYIFVDYNIINSAPEIYIKSAIGDIFSNFSAINDFVDNIEEIDVLSFEAKLKVLQSLAVLSHSDEFKIDKIVESIIVSGKAVELLKSSMAISGSEHLIFHSLETLYPNAKVNHGVGVASISLFTLYLQGKLKDEHIRFLKKNSISLNFVSLFDVQDQDLEFVFEFAKNYRPSRKTILNNFSNTELIKHFNQFEKKIQNIV